MIRFKALLIIVLCSVHIAIDAQNEINPENSSLSRFHYEGYKSFRDYIQRNAFFPPEAFEKTGVLLAGIILDDNGVISRVFCFNSLAPSIDNGIITLLESTRGHWAPSTDTINPKKNEIIIIPIVYCLKGTEYKIERTNFKLAVQKEIQLTSFTGGQQMVANNYMNTESLLKKYDKVISKEKYTDAYEIMIDLLKREPFNTDYYSRLIELCIIQGDNESACQNLKFVQTYFIRLPDQEVIEKVSGK
jgi:hypothetical protein